MLTSKLIKVTGCAERNAVNTQSSEKESNSSIETIISADTESAVKESSSSSTSTGSSIPVESSTPTSSSAPTGKSAPDSSSTPKSSSKTAGSFTPATKSEKSAEDTYAYLGIGIPKRQVWKDLSKNVNNGNNNGVFNNYQDKNSALYGYISDYFMSDEALAESQKKGSWDKQKIVEGSRPIYQIAVYKKGKAPNENILPEPEYLKGTHAEQIGETDKLVYFFYWDDFKGEGLSDASKNKYKQLYDDMMNFKNSIRIFTPDPKAVEAKIQELKKFQEEANKS